MVSVETIGSIFIKALKLVRFKTNESCVTELIEISVESLKMLSNPKTGRTS